MTRSAGSRRPAPAERVADELLRPDLVAEWLAVSGRTLREWRYFGTGPAWVKVEGRIRYRRSDVEAYIERNTQHAE